MSFRGYSHYNYLTFSLCSQFTFLRKIAQLTITVLVGAKFLDQVILSAPDQLKDWLLLDKISQLRPAWQASQGKGHDRLCVSNHFRLLPQ